MTALAIIIGLAMGNFLGALLGDRKWSTAGERTYFQAGAVIAYALILWANEGKV